MNPNQKDTIKIRSINQVSQIESQNIKLEKVSDNSLAERMNLIQKMSKIGWWEIHYDQDGEPIGNSVQWSDEMFRIYGYLPKEITATVELYYNHVHQEDLEDLNDYVFLTMMKRQTFTAQHRIYTKNGDLRHVSQHGEFIYNEDGELIKMVGITQDITERESKYQQLHNTKSKFQNILDKTDTGYILLDELLMVRSFNGSAATILQNENEYKLEEGVNYLDLLPSSRKKLFAKKILKALITNTHHSYETSYLKDKGKIIWLKIRMFPALSEDGISSGIIVAIDDITDQKIKEKEKESITENLIQKNNDLEQFAYIVSHNLRAPLANIMGLADLLPTLHSSESLYKEYMAGLESSSNQLNEVILDLNEILRIRKNASGIPSDISFALCLEDVCKNLSTLISNNKAVIKYTPMENDKIRIIKTYLFSIVNNLVENSIKFRKHNHNPVIDISYIIENNNTIITIKDNGIGIDLNKNRSEVFKLYKRFNTEISGRGIGLYMVKSQVVALGGKIEISSIINEGSTFRISLPA